MKRLDILMLCTPIGALILEILPYGAVCNFALDGGEILRSTFSYFDPIPFGYANFSPMIVALLTCALAVLALVYLTLGRSEQNRDNRRRGLKKAYRTVSALAAIISLAPMLYGIKYFSVVGAAISVVLALSFSLTLVRERTQ